MPVYLVHGFRWPREGFTGIRVHAVLHNLDDTSVEYIQNEQSKADILASFHKAFPDIMKELDSPGRNLEFIEQYNPEDTESVHAVSQPYAYVGDKVVTIAANPGEGTGLSSGLGQTGPASPATVDSTKAVVGSLKKPNTPRIATLEPTALSMNVEEVISEGPGLTNRAWEALADLRDKIASGEKIGWWVVYNGDPARSFDDYDDDEDYDDEYDDYQMEDVEEQEQQGAKGDIEPRAQKQPQQPPQQRISPVRQQQQQQAPQAKSALVSPTSTSASTIRQQRVAPQSTTQDDVHPESYVTSRTSQVPTFPPLPHIASQQLPQPQGDLTALPVRSAGGDRSSATGLGTGTSTKPSVVYPPTQPLEVTAQQQQQQGRGDKDRFVRKPAQQAGEVIPPPKVKEAAKPQGLRKKLFGKRS
ncbi:hypothetical protein LTR84_002783 [Exophiala bonariae]|uniref:Uncharacterized protein n=1 Tax=Exophiala bonariae TaxID=1690606 RepID=A0AAV9N9Y4_9EURO|nr:hypothetical protein LTR84_002783 [Exophiala bonariae]